MQKNTYFYQKSIKIEKNIKLGIYKNEKSYNDKIRRNLPQGQQQKFF